jgi:hypothetical protein
VTFNPIDVAENIKNRVVIFPGSSGKRDLGFIDGTSGSVAGAVIFQ